MCLDAPEDEVANVEGSCMHMLVMVTPNALVVDTIVEHGSQSGFLNCDNIKLASLFDFSFIIVLDAGSS